MSERRELTVSCSPGSGERLADARTSAVAWERSSGRVEHR
jgi:hypothetical protein